MEHKKNLMSLLGVGQGAIKPSGKDVDAALERMKKKKETEEKQRKEIGEAVKAVHKKKRSIVEETLAKPPAKGVFIKKGAPTALTAFMKLRKEGLMPSKDEIESAKQDIIDMYKEKVSLDKKIKLTKK
jgi:hypothetical protein